MEPTNHQLVRASLRDAAFTNMTVGMAESYFVAFMLMLGLSEVAAGAGKIIPMFIGVCFQMLAIRGPFRRMGLKKRVVGFVIIQALTFPLLAAMGFWKIESTYLVIFLLGLYWAAGLSSQPPWHRLIGETIPARFRLKFFALRNAWAQVAVIAGLLLAGWLMEQQPEADRLWVFGAIFLFCSLLKFLSARELALHRDVAIVASGEERVRLRDFLKRLKGTPQGQLVVFLFLWYFVVQLSGPYFDPYMLRKLNWGPIPYTIVIATSFLGRILAFRVLRNRAKPQQVPTILFFSCLAISLTPLWWSISTFYPWLVFIEFVSGCAWAGFELATIMLYFDRIKDHERTSLMTYISFFNTLGMSLGVLLGGQLLQSEWFTNNYLGLFITSAVLRFLCLLALPAASKNISWAPFVSATRSYLVSVPLNALVRMSGIKKKK